jgi:hypothetical protein
LSLQRREAGRQLLGWQRLARLSIVRASLLKRPVPDEAPCPGKLPQALFLVGGWLQTEAIDAVHGA